ncbi:MAG: trehalase family glycosidase [Sedimentisphaeraceae bacterium JB056]
MFYSIKLVVVCSIIGFMFVSTSLATERHFDAEKTIEVNIEQSKENLLHEEDTDNDKKITVDDYFLEGKRGDKKFILTDTKSFTYEINGTYYLSNLLQELTLAGNQGKLTASIKSSHIFEPPLNRIDRQIKELYWDGLTRRIDEANLSRIFTDSKTNTVDGFNYIYVPHQDSDAYSYFSEIAKRRQKLKIQVVKLPEKITAEWVKKLEGKHGILSLALEQNNDGKIEAVPFVVPGGRFNEMYGWDSYFESLGLLIDGRVDLAKAMVDNFVYEINNYGKILNANRSYYLTRSQPPFLTSMTRSVCSQMPETENTKQWLKISLKAAIKEYREVWTSPPRLTATGLSRYYGEGIGTPPEVEPGHFDYIFEKYAQKYNMEMSVFEQGYKNGKIEDGELDNFFFHDRSMRESGHDKTYRWDDRCGDFVTVDLNCLLYKAEKDIAFILNKYFESSLEIDGKIETEQAWLSLAEKRKKLLNEYCWSESHGTFLDYDIKNKKQKYYITPVAFYPLWSQVATENQAQLIVKNILPMLECAGGLASSTLADRGRLSEIRQQRQWDYPFGWAPHQIIAWKGLENYGYNTDVQRLMYRWLYTIVSNAAAYNGTVPEKFNVVTRSHKVFAEYGNVGTDFSYITQEGFGWMNASFKIGVQGIEIEQKEMLNRRIPPEWVWK